MSVVNIKEPELEPKFVISAPAPRGNLILAPRLLAPVPFLKTNVVFQAGRKFSRITRQGRWHGDDNYPNQLNRLNIRLTLELSSRQI
jgi:hypothetical protein